MMRRVGFLRSLTLTVCALSLATPAWANSDDELEQMLQQGLKKEPGPAERPAPTPPQIAEPKTPPPPPARVEAPKPVEQPKVEQPKPAPAKVEPAKAMPAKAAVAAPVEPKATPIAAEPAPAQPEQPEQPETADAPTTKSQVTPQQSLVNPGNPVATPKRATVSAAVNADQAALSNSAAKPWSIITAFQTSVGVGTFVANQYARNPYVNQALYLQPAYVFGITDGFKIRASLTQSFDWEYTKPDNTSARHFNWSDTLLGVSALAYQIPTVDISLWASYRMPIPISATSQTATLITAMLPGAGASRNFSWNVSEAWSMNLNVRYDVNFRKNFHRSTVPGYSNTATATSRDNSGALGAVAPTVLTRTSDNVSDGTLYRGGASTDWSISNALTIAFTPHDLVTITAYAALTNASRYPIATTTTDQFTSINAKVGAGRVDELRTNFDVTFNVLPYLLLSTGIFTVQPPFSPDNRRVNNPFINTDAAASNYSTFYASVTGII